MWNDEHPLELLTAYGNEVVGHWSRHGRSLELWPNIPKWRVLNVLVLWRSCVMGFDAWKYRKRIGMQLQLQWMFLDCMKCICNGIVHKMGHPQSKFDTENCFLAWIHTIRTLGLNKGKCYMCELLHCWNVRLVWWTHSTAFMMLDKLDALECTCNEPWNMFFYWEGMACVAYGKLNGMQESNVCLFCDIWLEVVYLRIFVHAQGGRTPLLEALRNDYVREEQALMLIGAHIEAIDEVQLVANVY